MSCQSAGEESDACERDPGEFAGDGALEVFCEPSAAAEPSEGALDDPAAWLGLEGSDCLPTRDDLNLPGAHVGEGVEHLLPPVNAIGKDIAQLGEASCDHPQQWHGTMIVLHIGGVHLDGEEEAFRIGDDMALAALDPLGGIKPAWTATFCGLRGLTVDDTG